MHSFNSIHNIHRCWQLWSGGAYVCMKCTHASNGKGWGHTFKWPLKALSSFLFYFCVRFVDYYYYYVFFFVDFFFCWLIFSFFLFVLLLFTYRNWTLFNSQRFNAQLNCLNSALIAIFLFLFRSCALSPHTVEMSVNCFFEV